MADLDDFFAKKDKKKSKGKKFTTVDQVAKKLEDTSKKPVDVKPKKEKEKSGPDGENVADINKQEEDEWKEFEEEKRDYSGLKIQNMQLTDSAESGGQGGDEDDSDDGEGGEGTGGGRGRKPAGPWKMPTSQEAANENDSEGEEDPQPEPEPKRPEPRETTSSYVPPHLRNQPASSGQPQQSRLKNKTAPDINNEAYFPTLSAAAANEPVGAWGRKGRNRDDERGFEDVRNSKSHSSRFEGARQASPWGQPGGGGGGGGGANRVSVENKFDALRQADQS